MASWPTTLPEPLVEAVTYESADNVIRTQMDAGLPKMRRRFTSVPETASFRLLLTRDQVQVLQDFVTITLSDVLSFTWREFRLPDGAFDDGTSNTATYRFLGRPRFMPASSGLLWYADISLEILSSSLTRALSDWSLDATTGERTPPILDLFVIVGQSNAEGEGDFTSSPAAPNGIYYDGATFWPLADPVGGADTGSMWPSFSNEWWAQTERRSAFIEQATGGSALQQSGTNWSPTGSLRAPAAAAANAAIAAINASPDYVLGNVYFVWCQGEADAMAINGTTITGPLYEQALEDLATYFKAQVPEMVTMAVIRTGEHNYESVLDAEWLAIRTAQEEACTDSALLRMVYRGASSFTALGYKSDTMHWTQTGYNMAGKCAARELSNESETAALPAPAYLASSTGTYSHATVAVATNTLSHTTHASTKTLVVATQAHRYSNTGLQTGGTCTFNGVSMTRIRTVGAGGTTPAGKDIVSIFVLTETQYGSTLGGVTANLVHTPASSQPLLQMVAVDLDLEAVLDWYVDGTITGGATGSSIAATMNATLPSFVLAIASSTSSGTTPATATIAGCTELLDGGGNNLTNSGQAVVGYKIMSESVGVDTSVTFSGTVGSAAFTAIGLRAKIDGE